MVLCLSSPVGRGSLLALAMAVLSALGLAGVTPAVADPGPGPPMLGAPPGFRSATDRVSLAPTPDGHGYWIADANGRVDPRGDAAALGGLDRLRLDQPVVAIAATPTGGGYWLAQADGRVTPFGDAPALGSVSVALHRPVVTMAATADGGGYWLIAADGGVFSFGDATFHGSTGTLTLNKPVVGLAATPTGRGYWLVAADGGIFNFGDARFLGSTGAMALNRPVVAMVASPTGSGYRLVAADGGLFTFGDSPFAGSLGATPPPRPLVGVARTPDGGGYWLLGQDGRVWAFGDAEDHGSAATAPAAVGTRTEVITDPGRPTPSRDGIPAHAGRVLPTTIFYPSPGAPGDGEAPGGPVAAGGPFPMIVFGPGFDVTAVTYHRLLHAWAESGYVVAAPEFPLSGPNGPGPATRGDLASQPGDLSAVIGAILGQNADATNWLGGAVDPNAVGEAGQSDGGSTVAGATLDSASHDPRIRAALIGSGSELAMAGGTYGGVANVAVLFVQGDQDPLNSPADSHRLFADAHDPKGYLDVIGGGHLGPYVDAGTQADLVRGAAVAFFDRELKGEIDGTVRLARLGNLTGLTALSGSLW